jgi:hypothetical protein
VPTFADSEVSRGQRGGSPTVVNLSFIDREFSNTFRKIKNIASLMRLNVKNMRALEMFYKDLIFGEMKISV